MYSKFLQMVDAGAVQTARIDDGMSHIYFRLQWPKQAAGEAAAPATEGTPGLCLMYSHPDLRGLLLMTPSEHVVLSSR